VTALAVCIVVGTLQVVAPAERFTLAWEHTVERVLWEEDYLVAGDWLFATGARIRGSGAGMEPPDGAVLQGGLWHYAPAQRWLRQIVLARSEFGADYLWCVDGRCRALDALAPRGPGPTVLRPCPARVPGSR
jgi:hypothetical protein